VEVRSATLVTVLLAALPHGPTAFSLTRSNIEGLITVGVTHTLNADAFTRSMAEISATLVVTKSLDVKPATAELKDTVKDTCPLFDTASGCATIATVTFEGAAGEEHASLAVVPAPATIHTALGSTDTAA
jgi:hypothetical protein